MAKLELNTIVKDYPGRRILRGITHTLNSGAVALLGPNGAGKSTLLGVLSTRLSASSGDFSLDGETRQKNASALRKQIGVVGHSSYLYKDLSLEENLMLFAHLYAVPDPHERVQEVTEQFKLTTRMDQPIGQFSRGLLQRAALARATLHKPKMLLLDEPFTGLDPSSSELLLQLIEDWRTAGKILLFATHDLHRAARSADRFLILYRGRIVSDVKAPIDGATLLEEYKNATSKKGP